LETIGGTSWLGTPGGRDWLQTLHGKDWLQTRGAKKWMKTQGGQDWLQNKCGLDWLKTQNGQDWLQGWLETLDGRDWLQTKGGRAWLQTQSGRDWLQTPYGEAWQSTPAASVWVTMEEFSSTLETISMLGFCPESSSLPAFQAIEQFKSLPDLLMFSVFVAFRHRDHSIPALPESHFSPDREIIHAMNAFVTFAKEALERSQSASDALKYACQNWAIHLSRSPNPWDETLNHVFKIFWNRHLLSWLERQWCLKGLQSCLVVLYAVQTLAKPNEILPVIFKTSTKGARAPSNMWTRPSASWNIPSIIPLPPPLPLTCLAIPNATVSDTGKSAKRTLNELQINGDRQNESITPTSSKRQKRNQQDLQIGMLPTTTDFHFFCMNGIRS
jgi:hypothetical protein